MSYEKIRKKLIDSKEDCAARLALWEKVSFKTKKDGTPFKVLSKNFENADLEVDRTWGEVKLIVHGKKGYSYINDDIYLTINKYSALSGDGKERGTISNAWGDCKQIMTLDEIKKAVSERICSYRNRIASLDNQLAESEKRFALVSEKLKEIREIIYENRKKPTTLDYALTDYVRGFNINY